MTGPVILDLLGCDLLPEEAEMLQHPLVGGVILFSRNFEDPQQLKDLCQKIRKNSRQPQLITVDQEGGRVQRFKRGFSVIPPMGELGKVFVSDQQKAMAEAEHFGHLMASELLSVGVDLSFAPVLDLNKELNSVVGDRSFHQDPRIVITLARAFMKGMHRAGMKTTGKHFPGHGSVTVDSHYGQPLDPRDFDTIAANDLIPFMELMQQDLDAIMPAHILFPEIDDKPVCFSEKWLKTILRKKLQFSGMIFSDDLNMKGAAASEDYSARAKMALDAGCDMVLICNNRQGALEILDHLPQAFTIAKEKFHKMQGQIFKKGES